MNREHFEQPNPEPAAEVKEAWQKPEILSFQPAASAQGISYSPTDGVSNLTL
jgi:hypothetical protein